MLFESAHVRVTAEYGVGTLWLGFPGEPVNALDGPRLRELDSALATIEGNPFLNALVVRSAKPAGFCAGLHPGVAEVQDRSAFAAFGQRVLSRLAMLPFVTVAFIDGPCLGVGFELALACDHRLCVATPNTHLGFPGRFTCFGGSNRLRKIMGKRARVLIESGRTLSGREARDLGLADRAFCTRRAKIELRTFLDELERRPRVPERRHDESGFADERRAFAALTSPLTVMFVPSFPPTGSLREPPPPPGGRSNLLTSPPEGEVGGASPPGGGDASAFNIAILLARGFITPLEAEQMLKSCKPSALPGPVTPATEDAQIRRAA